MFRLVIEIGDDFTRLVDEDGVVLCQAEHPCSDEDAYYYLIGHLCSHFMKLQNSKEEIEKCINRLYEGEVNDKTEDFAAKTLKGAVVKYICDEG